MHNLQFVCMHLTAMPIESRDQTLCKRMAAVNRIEKKFK